MQDSQTQNSANETHQLPGIGVDDVLFTLFRHKQLILAGFILGILAAGIVRVVYKPLWVSEAKLNVPYIKETMPTGPIDPEARSVFSDPNGQMIIGTEVEIIKSFDVASNAAYAVGPQLVLPKKSKHTNLLDAASIISAGLEIAPPQRATSLTIYFRHSDPTVVQPVLSAVIEAYKVQSFSAHTKEFDDDFYQRKVTEMKAQIAKEENDLKTLKEQKGVLSLEDTKKAYQERILKLYESLADAQRELAERKAVLGDVAQVPGGSSTNVVGTPPPPETIEEYNNLLTGLNVFKQKARELTLGGYKEAHPLMINVRGEIAKLNEHKAELIKQFPSLATIISIGTTNTATTGLADLGEIQRLTTRVAFYSDQLTNLEASIRSIIEMEPLLNSMQAQLNLDRTNFNAYNEGLIRARNASSFDPGQQVSITTIEKPTPPAKDKKKQQKILGAAFGGFVGLALALAFLIDFVLDRSIKRSVDIERHLRLPVFQTIPHTAWSNRLKLPWTNGDSNGDSNGHADYAAEGEENGNGNTSMTRWDPAQQGLHLYTEGLRERLMTYFEVNGLNKKPKLVGLTGCARGSGVTTLANGLAASLSKTGSGNVLFVDMNTEENATQVFFNGKANGHGEHAAAPAGEGSMFVTKGADGSSSQLVKYESSRIASLMPSIRESHYDYIVFDLPPVSQTSATARLAGYMDLTLLVLESERTGQQSAAKANALMRDARANVAAVLNKYRRHVPQVLSQDL